MKFRKGARKELKQLKKQKRHSQSVRYLEWQRNGHGEGGRIQKKKGAMNMRGINGQMNRIFTQLDIYEKQEPKKQDTNDEDDIQSDDSNVDLGDRLERAYRNKDTKEEVEVKESREDRIARLRQENEAEEREIAKLEKLLYLNKRKNNNMPKSFVEEGLDFLMEVVDKKYKKKYNDDMELLGEEGELTNALMGNKDKDDSGEDEDESSGDELTQQNEQRRKVRFNEEDSADSDISNEMEVDDEDEEMDEEEELVGDSEEDVPDEDLDEDLSEEDLSGSDGSSEEEEEEEEEEERVSKKPNPDTKMVKKTSERNDLIKKDKKVKKTDDADEIMRQLKLMREKKNKGKGDDKNDKKNRMKTKSSDEELEDSDGEDFDEEDSEAADLNSEDESQMEDLEDSADEEGESDQEGGSDNDSIVADGFIRKKNKVADDGTYEDIYGRKRNARGDVLETTQQKYVPPAKRLAMGNGGNNKIELEKLQKQVKGQLNRLSETNLRPIATLFSELYSKHSKNNVTSTLSLAIGDSVFGLSQTPERLVLEPALLCALLHANEGHEVGAQILEDLVDRLKSLLEDEEERTKGKQLENVLRFLCYLFLFKVVSHGIIYGVLKKLNPTNENDIELILVILRTCGFALRRCDPLALKELIISLQTKSQNASSSTRHRFMLETLSALKNNNISKISNCDPSLSDKALKSLRLCLNKGAVLQELNVSLDDLYDARVKGKWWLVGSAWSKDEDDERSARKFEQNKTSINDEFSDKIVELSRKAGMNTDIRRSIFCIIMSAEDYLDASERILRLNLTHVQQREFCYVLLLCAGNEKRFNPYYAHLALFFCNQNKKVFSMTLQCAIWDAIKAISSYSERKVSNLARFTALLVHRGGLPLAVLKNIEFVDLSNDKVIQFLRVLLLDILLNMKSENVQSLFSKIALAGPKLQLLKEGLGVFMKRFLLRNVKLGDAQTEAVKKNLKAAEEGLDTQIEKSDVDIFD